MESELYEAEEGRLAVDRRPDTGREGREKAEGVTPGIPVGVKSSDTGDEVSTVC